MRAQNRNDNTCYAGCFFGYILAYFTQIKRLIINSLGKRARVNWLEEMSVLVKFCCHKMIDQSEWNLLFQSLSTPESLVYFLCYSFFPVHSALPQWRTSWSYAWYSWCKVEGLQMRPKEGERVVVVAQRTPISTQNEKRKMGERKR